MKVLAKARISNSRKTFTGTVIRVTPWKSFRWWHVRKDQPWKGKMVLFLTVEVEGPRGFWHATGAAPTVLVEAHKENPEVLLGKMVRVTSRLLKHKVPHVVKMARPDIEVLSAPPGTIISPGA